MNRLFLLSILLTVGTRPFIAQSLGATSMKDTEEFQPNLRPTLEIQRLAGAVEIDGDLNDPGWVNAARAMNFAEFNPGDRTKPPVETDVMITYDDTHLYVAFIAHDDPSTIRSSLRDRDEIWSDDYVGILLDTYGDAAWAFYLFSNPIGIQGDSRFSSSGGEDESFDVVYESRGLVTDEGYQVEMAIPFRSLRFPDRPQQTWRVTFWRNHPRDSRRKYSWASLDRDDPCFLCQFGTITGMEGIQAGKNFEFLPTVIGSQSGSLNNGSDPSSGFDNGSIEGEASLGLKYAITSNLTTDVTLNPDFSQVEADVAQIDVNTTFALFFPERRPFFQEGSDLFQTWIRTVYTRTLNDPSVAAKLTGRFNRTSIAYIGGRDELTPIILPFEERSAFVEGGRSISNILRIKQTFQENSYVGALVTDRHLDGGGSGTTIGADALLRFLRNYRLESQVVVSHTREPRDTNLTAGIIQRTFDRGAHTTAFDGESFWGRSIYASLERDAKMWNFDFDYWEWSPTFRADNGFVTSNEKRQGSFWTGLFFWPNTALIDRIIPNIAVGRVWNFAGVRKDEWISPSLEFTFKAQTTVDLEYIWTSEQFRDIEFGGMRHWNLYVDSKFSDPVQIGFFLSNGRFIARNLSTPVLGEGTNFEAWATLKPLQRLIIKPEYSFSQLDHLDEGPEIFHGYILRTRLNYQFTRELFLRLVVQYNDFSQVLEVDPLLTYRLNAFTAFFIGSTYDYRDFNRSTGFSQTARQFFMKFQYLIRV